MAKAFSLVLLLAAFTGCGPEVAEQWKPRYEAPRRIEPSSDNPYANMDWFDRLCLEERRGYYHQYESARCDDRSDKGSDKHCDRR